MSVGVKSLPHFAKSRVSQFKILGGRGRWREEGML